LGTDIRKGGRLNLKEIKSIVRRYISTGKKLRKREE